jgi:hypothetical protein
VVTATPNTLGDVLGQIVQAAADAAAAVPQDLQNVFDQAGRAVGDAVNEAEDLPANALAQLKQLIDPPDWASLLIFVLVKISELDPAHLSVGSMQPDGWSRTLTLTYTLEPGKTVTVGFAMTDPAPAKHGFILQATAGLETGDLPIGPLTFSVSSPGDTASWRMAFSGAEAKLNLSKLLGALGSIVNITAIDETYSPALMLTQGEAPKFDLGHKSQP